MIISDDLCEKLGIYAGTQCFRLSCTKLNVDYNSSQVGEFKGEGKGREEKRRGGKIGEKEREKKKCFIQGYQDGLGCHCLNLKLINV